MTPEPTSAPLRVALRVAVPADAPLLHRWRSEPSVRRHQPLSEATVSELRTDLTRQRPEEIYRGRGDRFQWIVLVEGDPAGWLTLAVTSWEHAVAEVGYALSSSFQRLGVMPVALEQLAHELFLRTPIERLEARCAVDNRGSQRVLERLGFEREGLLRRYFRMGEERIDNYLYALLRDDWLRARDAPSS